MDAVYDGGMALSGGNGTPIALQGLTCKDDLSEYFSSRSLQVIVTIVLALVVYDQRTLPDMLLRVASC